VNEAVLDSRGRLLIAAPMRLEAALIASAAAGAQVRKTGMGPERSKRAVEQLAAQPARGLVVLGFCGGLDADSVPGEVIVAEELYAADDEGHVVERVVCDRAGELLRRVAGQGMKVRSGHIVSSQKLALGERRAQLLAGGAIAVDMESVWLAAAAGARPFGVVRVVLDSPAHELLRLQAAGGALRAAGALRRVAAALHDWVPAG
jgi:4-hydroxy-3-methylbut-2-enyl diphosphate reductase